VQRKGNSRFQIPKEKAILLKTAKADSRKERQGRKEKLE
jgi:hypothetical protein